jgi:hypothetical protein
MYIKYRFFLFKTQIYTDLRNTFSFSKKRKPVLKEKQISLVKLSF